MIRVRVSGTAFPDGHGRYGWLVTPGRHPGTTSVRFDDGRIIPFASRSIVGRIEPMPFDASDVTWTTVTANSSGIFHIQMAKQS